VRRCRGPIVLYIRNARHQRPAISLGRCAVASVLVRLGCGPCDAGMEQPEFLVPASLEELDSATEGLTVSKDRPAVASLAPPEAEALVESALWLARHAAVLTVAARRRCACALRERPDVCAGAGAVQRAVLASLVRSALGLHSGSLLSVLRRVAAAATSRRCRPARARSWWTACAPTCRCSSPPARC
jgi:hypothetical protein